MFQCTLEDLREKVQASDNELREGLKKLEALEIDGELKLCIRYSACFGRHLFYLVTQVVSTKKNAFSMSAICTNVSSAPWVFSGSNKLGPI